MTRKSKETKVIKVDVPRLLAERFRRHVAERYGFRRGVLSKAIADLIEKELGATRSQNSNTVDKLVRDGFK